MEYHIEKLASPNAVVGEGPVWSSEEKKIYWTDIYGGKLFRFDPLNKTNEIIILCASKFGVRKFNN